MWQIYLSGFGLSMSLIAAIGGQNAYVLRQALQRAHIGLIVTLCVLIDSVLIAAGVAGMSKLLQRMPHLLMAVKWAGALFLFCYGTRAFWTAWRGSAHLKSGSQPKQSARSVAITVLALSLLNPHVYLDTVALLGTIGGQYPWPANAWFTAGAINASILWFCALGFGAKFAAPLFTHKITWRVLDIIIGTIMWTIAVFLVQLPT